MLGQTPLVAQATAIPASGLCRKSQRRLARSNGAIPLVKANRSSLVAPLSTVGLVLANDIGRKWARWERPRREVLSAFSFLLLGKTWRPVLCSHGELIHGERGGGVLHRERIQQEDKRRLSPG